MVKIGFLFPGQGAQSVGMGKEYYDQFSCARAVFDKASTIIGKDLAEICFTGPEDVLTQTINAQVAIFTTSVAILEALKETYPHIEPAVNCGLSLGEYSALVSAGILDFEVALTVVQKRGELMEQAAGESQGGMVSIIGLSEEACANLAQEYDVDVANFNSPEQIVLSGKMDNIKKVEAATLSRGAKKAIILKVGGAFHSRLMEPAAVGMQAVLSAVSLQKPTACFIPNVTGEPVEDIEKLQTYLIEQVTHSVKWTQTMQYALGKGITTFCEIGPGKVLKGLVRRIDKSVSVISLEKVESLKELDSFVVV